MSLLMFHVDPDQGYWVVTDTLATDRGFQPSLYQSKAIAIPHLDMVIAGTGIAQMNARWWSQVMDQILCLDVEMLDLHTPPLLRTLWKDVQAELGPVRGTATIYHLGRSTETGQFRAFAYRSTNDFASEPLAPGFRIRPDPPGVFDTPQSIEEIIQLAEDTRRKEDARPPGERIHIGGELVMFSVQPEGTHISRIHRWSDHGEMWIAMNDLLRQDDAGQSGRVADL